MFLRSLVLPALVALATAAAPIAAAQAESSHQHGATATGNSSTRAYKTAMKTMHKNMRTPLAGNADVDFSRQMIPHHQAALAMARIQQKYGRDASLKRFNDWVIFAQEIEIAMMTNWLRRRDNGVELKGATDYYGEAMAKMHHAMAINYSGDADVDYARGMIAHHQGAVDMASIWLKEGTDPEIRQLAHDVYSTQTLEIAWLRSWLDEHGASH